MRKNTKTKALCLLLALVMVLGLLPGTALAAEEEIVSISTAEELAAFRDRVNSGEKNLNAKLTGDIQLTGAWTPFNPSSGSADCLLKTAVPTESACLEPSTARQLETSAWKAQLPPPEVNSSAGSLARPLEMLP